MKRCEEEMDQNYQQIICAAAGFSFSADDVQLVLGKAELWKYRV